MALLLAYAGKETSGACFALGIAVIIRAWAASNALCGTSARNFTGGASDATASATAGLIFPGLAFGTAGLTSVGIGSTSAALKTTSFTGAGVLPRGAVIT